MKKFIQLLFLLVALPVFAVSTPAATSLTWDPKHVKAQVENIPLPRLLEDISAATGWEVYVEPGTTVSISAKFNDLPETEALKRLLGSLNFSLTPQTNSVRKLYVFKTSVGQATQLVRAAPSRKGGKIANELVVALKPGTSIEDLAKKLGAKIVGRNDGLNTYRLRFDDEESAEKARQLLLSDEDVTGVEPNFAMDAPPPPDPKTVASTALPPFNVTANPDPNHIVVGLIDSHVQPLDASMQPFMLQGFNEAGAWNGDPNDPTHGTFMAESILHALQVQLGGSGNSSIRILPIDVYGNGAQTTTFDVANGISLAMQNGARIINLSLGSSGDSAFLQQIIASGSRQGIIFIAAAGNTPVTSATFPAAYNGVLAVTAADLSGKLAPYANRGAFVDVMFPGSDMGKIGLTAYQVNGTSTATALASGTAAALIQKENLSSSATLSYMTSKWSFQSK